MVRKMAHYNVFRVSKIKTNSQIKIVSDHNFRLNKNLSNVNYDKTNLNKFLIGSQQDNLDLLFDCLKQEHKFKFRNDQNKFCEIVVSASHEYLTSLTKEQQQKFFLAHLKFLEEEVFKVKGSIISAVVHNDEKTPHMHIVASPLIERKKEISRGKLKGEIKSYVALSYEELFGGKDKLIKLQDNINNYLKEQGFELERGKSKEITRKSHKTTFQHLRQIEQKFEDYKNTKVTKQDKALVREMQEEYKNQRIEHQKSLLAKITNFSTVKLDQTKFKQLVEFCIKLLNKNKKLEQELNFKETDFKQKELELNNKENLLNKKQSNFEQYYKNAKYQIQKKVDELQDREIKFNSELSNLKNKYEKKILHYVETLNEISEVFSYKPALAQAFNKIRDEMYQERENYQEEQQNTNKTKYTY